MRFSIRAFTGDDADAVSSWRYPPPYDVYDASEDPSFEKEMRDPTRWGELEFAVDDAETGELAGFLELTVIENRDFVEIGLGLKPDLTGRGLGCSYVEAAMAFARERWRPSTFALDVFPWNERAIRAYERAGFERGEVYVRQFADGNEVTFLRMARPAEKPEA
ncbi:MAG: GNAT family N-acetyltransferase [Actinomycetota bacterium]